MRRLTWPSVINRPTQTTLEDDAQRVDEILGAVAREGDRAVRRYVSQFEGWDGSVLEVEPTAMRDALERLPRPLVEALNRARENIEAFHARQGYRSYATLVERGMRVERLVRPLRRVGIYVPAGTAPLPSSLLMAAVPARLAGCPELIVCTPRDSNGAVAPATLAAAALCGVDRLFCVGGAQAIAAMAYGTETIPRVDKIVGPGNRWVTLAKSKVAQDPRGAAIDLPAGPSEVMVVADDSASATFVASDLLSQAEHGSDSHVVLVSLDETLAEAVESALRQQLARIDRSDIAFAALDHAVFVSCKSREEALAAIDSYAPEHLILQVREPEAWLPEIGRAGSIFCGLWTPETVGDYASGSNHVLPTGGWARSHGGLGVESFQRTMTAQTLTRGALERIGPTLETLSAVEGLGAHGAAVRMRLATPRPEDWDDEVRELPTRILAASLEPYSVAPSVSGTLAIRLNANELSDAHAVPSPWNRYPEPQPRQLRDRLAYLYGVNRDQLLITRGADEAIDLVVRTFGGMGEPVLVTPPTYGYYATAARVYGSPIIQAPLCSKAGFVPDLQAVAAAAARAKIVFLCNPNNPTGTAWSRGEILRLLEATRGRALVVIDEAYSEFAPHLSATDLVGCWPNLLVIRTLSKAWGLAGARIGAVLATTDVLAQMTMFAAPYPISSPSVAAALSGLEGDAAARLALRVAAIRAERRRLVERLRQQGNVLEILPSETNFLFVRVVDAERILAGLVAAGVHVRDRRADVFDAIRVTVGSPHENDALIRAWERLR